MEITILGSGSSRGIPSLNMGWGVCDYKEPKNFRTRSSLLLKTPQTTILFDTPPEVRMHLLKAGNPIINAVVYTHLHYDHSGGAGDLVAFNCMDGHLPIYLPEKMVKEYQERFDYIFSNKKTKMHLFPITKEPFQINELTIQPILQNHGNDESMGYRIGDFAYTTDVKYFSGRGLALLEDLDTWVIGVVTTDVNDKHITLDEAMSWIEQVKPKRVYLTHLGSRMDYETLCKKLPDFIRPAYDGLKIKV